MERTRKITGWVLAWAVLLVPLVFDPPAGMPESAWLVAGAGGFMAALWIFECLPFAVTALLPIVLFPLLGVATVQAATAPYANPIIYLFLGGIFIALGMERWGLHRRLALEILRPVGGSPSGIVAGFLLASAFLSMWINNTATAVMMLPIGLSVVALLRDRGEAWHGIWASALMLAIAYGANIGGFFTLIGTAPNALLAGYLQTEFGYEIGFARWMLFAVPIGLILLPLVWAWLCFGTFRLPSRKVPEIAQIVQRERAALGTWSHAEQRVLVVFVLTATLWITRPLWPIPGLSDPVIAMLGGLSLFLLPAGGGRKAPILVWEDAKKIPWEVLLLLGGGFSLAETVQSSGLAEYLGTQLKVWGISGGLLLVAAVALLILVLTEITSNSATTAAFLPILGALAVGLGENPVLLCAVATVAASGAFMLPVATPPNAIVFAGGLVTVRQMMRAGIVVNLLFLLLLMVAAHWWGRWIFAR